MTGGPYSQVNPGASAHLEDVRALIYARPVSEAEVLAQRTLMGRPLKQMSYQPAGDLSIEQNFPARQPATVALWISTPPWR